MAVFMRSVYSRLGDEPQSAQCLRNHCHMLFHPIETQLINVKVVLGYIPWCYIERIYAVLTIDVGESSKLANPCFLLFGGACVNF